MQMRICNRDTDILEWLLLFAYEMLNEEFTRVHIFIGDDYIIKLKILWEELVSGILFKVMFVYLSNDVVCTRYIKIL
jgi:hypothetical protein